MPPDRRRRYVVRRHELIVALPGGFLRNVAASTAELPLPFGERAGVRGRAKALPPYSARMPAERITSAHLPASVLNVAPHSSGVLATGS